MTYSETLDFLFNQLPAYQRIGKAAYKSNLNNTIALDDYFGHPHLNYKTIHVAGTNGKGSVSHMIASILQEAGYRTGLYTSPHLKDFRERIKVNGEMISENEVISFVKKHKSYFTLLNPSFFELTVAMAFAYFAKCKVDVAVIEVGLGGRLDSTNIIKPALSVITNIGHDHMDLLGNSIMKIALEKAGIIKKDVPILIGETHSLTKELFISRAAEMGSTISFADNRFLCEFDDNVNLKEVRRYNITDLLSNKNYDGETVLIGDYQLKNLKVVFGVLNELQSDFNFSDENIKDGIRKVVINTGIKGRWQILSYNPLTICDTGHNKEGLEYIINQISRTQKSGLHMIIGFVNDKDLNMVLSLFPVNAIYYFTKASIPRMLNEKNLKSEATKYGLKGHSFPDVKMALYHARKNASKSDMIFIGGSSFIVAEVI